jgi:hypothetical protein
VGHRNPPLIATHLPDTRGFAARAAEPCCPVSGGGGRCRREGRGGPLPASRAGRLVHARRPGPPLAREPVLKVLRAVERDVQVAGPARPRERAAAPVLHVRGADAWDSGRDELLDLGRAQVGPRRRASRSTPPRAAGAAFPAARPAGYRRYGWIPDLEQRCIEPCYRALCAPTTTARPGGYPCGDTSAPSSSVVSRTPTGTNGRPRRHAPQSLDGPNLDPDQRHVCLSLLEF